MGILPAEPRELSRRQNYVELVPLPLNNKYREKFARVRHLHIVHIIK